MVIVRIQPAELANPMPGRRFVVSSDGRGWWSLTSPTGRQPIAQSDKAEELRAYALKEGAKAVAILD